MSIGEFEPLWLDPQSRCLYAALHRVAGHPLAGVLLVPPLLHELARSRRFLTEVASGLAEQGVPCLRFDFYGTGDSSGGGDDVDFASMHADLDVAVAALREHTGVQRVVLLAWRGAALLLRGWIERGGHADLVVLWEPITDGSRWLQELERGDADERAQRPPPRPGVACTTDPADGQLMGFPASTRLRDDLARARPIDGPVWLIVRAEPAGLPMQVARLLPLPDSAPNFEGGAAMDATFFLAAPVGQLVDQLGQALREQTWQ